MFYNESRPNFFHHPPESIPCDHFPGAHQAFPRQEDEDHAANDFRSGWIDSLPFFPVVLVAT
jgi:hypothetical protein